MTSIPQPDFSDNRNGRTLAAALTAYLDHLTESRREPVSLSIATGYFNPEGFALLASQLERLGRVRLLIGAEPTVPPAKRWRKPGEPRGDRYDAEQIRRALRSEEESLKQDRDLLGFTRETDQTLERLVQFLDSGKIEVRRYERGFVHGKAFLFSDGAGVLSGSSNFTYGGLVGNLELNLGNYQPAVLRQVSDWFEDLWEEAVPYDLADLYRARFQAYDPYLIYLRVLWELYGDEIREETPEGGVIRLTTFQNDGLFRVERIMESFNGAIVADGVGLGKTYLAGKVIERVRQQRQRVLLISPAALRDGTWRAFLNRHQLMVDSVSYEQLAADAQLGGNGSHLESKIEEYALVVVDEAHAFRNPDAQRAQALRTLLQGDPPKKLLLLTATPVNNSLWDLYYLLTYFVGHDAAFSDSGIPSLRQRFKEAQQQDPLDLRPETLYDILDRTTVRRTRHFVKKYYPGETIPGPEGETVTITFPKPQVSRVDYDLESQLPGFLAEFEQALAPETEEPGLTLARYWPSKYRRDRRTEANELALVGLMRTGLLKRFESSIHAFAETAGRMAESDQRFIAGLDAGWIPSPQAIEEWHEVDSDEAWEELLEISGSKPANEFDVERLRADVAQDRDRLLEFERKARAVTRDRDPKLAALADELAEIAAQAEREGLNDEDVQQKRKVLVFTYYADTVTWIEEYLHEAVENDDRLAAFRGRVASVSGQSGRRGVSREAAIYGFAPHSTEAPPAHEEDRFDILVTTDVLAEGMNLQQARNIINFDLPWNPMRLVQRHGRIDRIGSPHNRVYLRCFFPDRQLEELLTLVLRIQHKLAQAAASVGVESQVIPDSPTADRVFTETRKEIERLRREDASLLEAGGETIHAHSGEEYRQELRQGLIEREEEILGLPWGAGSGFRGLRDGHFFCARVGDRVFLRFVPADPEEDLLEDTLSCLAVVGCEPDTKGLPVDEIRAGAYEAWLRARRSIFEAWDYATDPANLQPEIRPLFREVAAHVRENPPTGTTQEEVDRFVEKVEAPWGLRHERVLREVWREYEEAEEPTVLSEALIQKVEELGLQPFQAPEPLDPIEEEEVKLVCWMAIREREDLAAGFSLMSQDQQIGLGSGIT